MKPRTRSIDLAARVVLIPSLCLIVLVAFAATEASRHSRLSLQEGASHAASILADGAVARLTRTGRLPESPEGTQLRLVSMVGDDIFSTPADHLDREALSRLSMGAAQSASWLDNSGDGLLRLWYCRNITVTFPGDPKERFGVLMVSMNLNGADELLFERAVTRTAWLILGGVVIFAAMISCVRWIGIGRVLRSNAAMQVSRELRAAATEAEQAEQSAMTRLVREAEELASVAIPPKGPDENVEGDLERLRVVSDELKLTSERLSAVAINCAVGAARTPDFDAELFSAAEALRKIAEGNLASAEQIISVCQSNEEVDNTHEAFERVGFLLKVAHEAAERQETHRELAAQISQALSGESQNSRKR